MLLKTFERFFLVGIVALVAVLYAQQSTENVRLYIQLQRMEIRVNQLEIDLKYYTDPDVIRDRTIKRLLGHKENVP